MSPLSLSLSPSLLLERRDLFWMGICEGAYDLDLGAASGDGGTIASFSYAHWLYIVHMLVPLFHLKGYLRRSSFETPPDSQCGEWRGGADGRIDRWTTPLRVVSPLFPRRVGTYKMRMKPRKFQMFS